MCAECIPVNQPTCQRGRTRLLPKRWESGRITRDRRDIEHMTVSTNHHIGQVSTVQRLWFNDSSFTTHNEGKVGHLPIDWNNL